MKDKKHKIAVETIEVFFEMYILKDAMSLYESKMYLRSLCTSPKSETTLTTALFKTKFRFRLPYNFILLILLLRI